MSKKHLLIREWVISFVILGVVASLFLAVSSPSTISSTEDIINEDVRIPVTVKGLVEVEGVYQVVPGTSLKEIIQKARPLSGWDSERVYLKKVVLDSASIEVVEKKDKKKRAKKH